MPQNTCCWGQGFLELGLGHPRSNLVTSARCLSNPGTMLMEVLLLRQWKRLRSEPFVLSLVGLSMENLGSSPARFHFHSLHK
jgi:hypothetical protein